MKILTGVLIALLSLAVHAQTQECEWNWYYAAFYSPSSASRVMLRSGTATVKMSHSEIVLRFTEGDSPETQASFSGRITGPGNVRGTLKGFFPSGAENFSGAYRQMGETKSCRWQEIVLRSSVPDGSALVLSRIEGPCQ